MSSDWDLICNGNSEALGRLYDKMSDMLFGYGMKIVPNKDVVEDAIHDLFLSLFLKAKTMSPPKSIKVYLCVALKNRILNELTSARTEKMVSINEQEETGTPFDGYSFKLQIDPQSIAILDEEENEQQTKLQKALDELTDRQREIIYLRYYKGLSGEEVAEIIDSTPQVVYNATSQIIKRLKEKMTLRAIILILFAQNW